MPNVHDQDGNTVGSIEHDGDRIVARDIDNRVLGRYATAVEAVSACFAAWRQDEAAPVCTVEQAAEAQREFWAGVRGGKVGGRG